MTFSAEEKENILRAREKDTASRQLAVSVFDQPLALEAGAGTGKTTVLVERILAWCTRPGWEKAEAELRAKPGPTPDAADIARRVAAGVCAITFTEKAAAELEDRVAEALSRLAGGEDLFFVRPSQGQPFAALSPEQARARAGALLLALDFMTLGTIHSFCRGVITRHALTAGLHPAAQVDAEGLGLEEVVRDVMREALALALSGHTPGNTSAPLRDAAPGLLRLFERATDMDQLADALLNLASEHADGKMLEKDLFPLSATEAFSSEFFANLSQLAQALEPLLAEKKLRKPKHIAERCWTMTRQAEKKPSLQELVCLAQENAKVIDQLEDWGRGKWNDTEEKCETLNRPLLVSSARQARKHLSLLLKLEDQDTIKVLAATLAPLLREVQSRARQKGLITFQGMLKEALAVLQKPRVAALERGRLRLLLVDEFQDTDATQCDMVRQLALKGDNRPALFVVGDPKQCIYAWRAADLASYENFLEAMGGEKHTLTVNHRSRPEILKQINRLMPPVMVYETGVQPQYENLTPSEKNEAAGNFAETDGPRRAVEFWRFPDAGKGKTLRAEKERQWEARQLAQDLLALKEKGLIAGYSEAALLLRATSSQEIYLRALREAGVPYAVQVERHWFLQRVVLDAAALLRVVLDPADHLALLTWLRSPAVGLPDWALLRLWQKGLPDWFSQLSAPGDPLLDTLELKTAEAAQELATQNLPAAQALRHWPVSFVAGARAMAALRFSFAHDATDVFFDHLHALFHPRATEAARFLGQHRLATLNRFLWMARETLHDPHGGPVALLRGLRNGALGVKEVKAVATPAEPDALQVMTIHTAKGLEFDHVYLADMARERGRQQSRDFFKTVDGEPALMLMGHGNLLAHRALVQEEKIAAAETVRLLYVAATRARLRLVLMAPLAAEATAPAPKIATLADLLKPTQAGWPPAGEPPPDAAVRQLSVSEAPTQPTPTAGAVQVGESPSLCADTLLAAENSLVQKRILAQSRQSRPWRATPSAQAHHAWREYAESQDGTTAPAPPRHSALAVGVLVHGVLEKLDLNASPQAALAALPALLQQAARRLDTPPDATALKEGGDLLENFLQGPLGERLLRLGPRVLARELPLLLAPAEALADAPVGAVSGALDLLYEDDNGEWVVVDFKTDHVLDETTLQEKAAAYAPQGQLYVQAVAQALGLKTPPRFELWFLRPGRVV